MKTALLRLVFCVVLSVGPGAVPTRAAVFKEVGGQVVIEAEHFSFRTNEVNGAHHYAIIPEEAPSSVPFNNARGSFLQNLPDSGANNNAAGSQDTPPYVDWKVQITTTGQYQLYLRQMGLDGGADSAYAQILELKIAAGGPGPDWYRYAPNPDTPDFAQLQNDPNDATTAGQGWSGFATPEVNSAGGGETPAVWTVSTPGTYTIRLSQREDGTAIDALILQLSSSPAPTNPGPTESDLASGILIATQPSDKAVRDGQTTTFTVATKVPSGVTPTYQWQKAAPGSTNFADIPSATGASYTTPAAAPADDGTKYRVIASITGDSVASRAANLTVDVTPPSAVRASGSDAFNKVTVTFSEPVDPASATNTANYAISGLTVSGATLVGTGTKVVLATSTQTTNANYTLTVSNVADVVGNTLSPNPSQVGFHGWVLASGGILHKFWDNITQNNIAGLTNNSRFPDSPSFVTIEPVFEYPPNGANEAGDNYGNQLSGFLTAPQTGNYVFFTCSDDPSSLYLSINESSANKKLVATETVWSNPRSWNTSGGGSDLTAKRSDQYAGSEWPTTNSITLTAGNRYYIEVLHTEGGGGDNVGVAWTLPGGTDPLDGDPPIPGSAVSFYYGPDGAVSITQQPQSTNVPANSPVAFSALATGLSDFGTTVRYQWQQAASGSSSFADISGATNAQYAIPFAASSDSGAQFRAILSVLPAGVPFDYSRTTSSVATLTVISDTTPPAVTDANGTIQNVSISFSEPLDQTSATAANNYTIGQGVSVNSATLVSPPGAAAIVKLAISGATAGKSYTVTINGVKDRANNAIAPNTTVSFNAYNAYYDFNDGQVPSGTTVGGSGASVLSTGGINDSGVLQLTPAVGSRQGGFSIPDLVNGSTVTNFTVSLKLFIGQGSGNPADGFSFNFATDLVSIDNTTEEGAGTGITVAFDTYDNGGGEAPAIGIKFSGIEFAKTNLTKATLVNDQYVDVTIRLDTNGTLTVMHNGTTYFDKVDLTSQGYSPMTGATFLLGARTGGEFETHRVDNLAILENAELSAPLTPPTISHISLSSGMVTINWTGGGTLEYAASLPAAQWTSTGNSSGTFSEAVTGGAKFYRVRR